jgi:hypothetical protein
MIFIYYLLEDVNRLLNLIDNVFFQKPILFFYLLGF